MSSSRITSANAIQEQNEQAVPFIIYSPKDGFKLSAEAESYLSTLNPNRKIGVISIVGKYRTGKSFLVNRVLLNRHGKKSGFSVGPTINPCTKGLWLWRQTLRTEETEEDLDVLLLDTEGFGGMDENTTHDSRIFLFSLLLSSYFIYNSQGNIDETALNTISLIINLAKDIKASEEQQHSDPADYFPSFLWIVRDFALQMVDKDGRSITSKDYLEKALENQKGVSDAVEQKNKIRRQLKHFFKERDCTTLVRPIESEADLQRLNEMEDSELRPQFVQQIAQLRQKIFRKVKPKLINGRTITGPQLLDICKAYLKAINGGSLPNIESAWKYMCKNESLKAIQETIQTMGQKFEERLRQTNGGGPMLASELHAIKQQVMEQEHQEESFVLWMREEIMLLFKKKSIASEEDLKEYYEQLDGEFSEKFKEFKQKNNELLQRKFQDLCEDSIEDLKSKLNSDAYHDMPSFESDLHSLRIIFQKQVGINPESNEYFQNISEILLKQATSTIGEFQRREQDKQLRVLQQRIQLEESKIQSAKEAYEKEKQALLTRVSNLEREKAQLLVSEGYLKEQLAKSAKDQQIITDLKRQNEQLQAQLANQSLNNDKTTQLSAEINKLSSDCSSKDKQLALMEQERRYKDKEIKRLTETCDQLQGQLGSYQSEQAQLSSTLNNLKQQMNDMEAAKTTELQKLQLKHDRLIIAAQEQSANSNNTSDKSNSTSEAAHRAYLENQVSFLQNQLEENKRLHDALLLALSQGMQSHGAGTAGDGVAGGNEQQLSVSSLQSIRSLQSTNERLEEKCNEQNAKIQKLKGFKRLLKHSTTIQCVCCSKFIPTRSFQQHLDTCQLSPTLPSSLSNNRLDTQQQQPMSSSQISQHSQQASLSVMVAAIEPSALHLQISSTAVKESLDHKPYTEYILQVNYLNQATWKVAKKYKNFCELHHALSTQFAGLKFPESSLAIINTAGATTTAASSEGAQKRPTFIEDRRKALQQYIKDLNKIECVRNSRVFRAFIEFDAHTLTVTSSTKIPPANPTMKVMTSSFVQQQQQQNNNNNSGTSSNSSRNITSSITNNYNDKENEQSKSNNLLMRNHHQQQLSSGISQSSQQQFVGSQQDGYQQQQQTLPMKKAAGIGGSFVEAWQNKENSKVSNKHDSVKSIQSNIRSKSMTDQQQLQFKGNNYQRNEMEQYQYQLRQQEQEEEDERGEEVEELQQQQDKNELQQQYQHEKRRVRQDNEEEMMIPSPLHSPHQKNSSANHSRLTSSGMMSLQHHHNSRSQLGSLSSSSASLLVDFNQLAQLSKSQPYTYNFIKTQQQRSPVANKQIFLDRQQPYEGINVYSQKYKN